MPQPEVEERVRAAREIALFLDFDGTLAAIAPHPGEARLDGSVRETLARLSRKRHIVTTIISGRALEDLRARVGLPRIVYAGNHGLEIDGGELHYVDPVAAAARDELRRVTDRLAWELRTLAGVLVEYKGLATAIHFRTAARADVPWIERSVRHAVERAAVGLRLVSGKEIWEILPRTNWHKGLAVRWILARVGGEGTLCVYFGDDRTDEDAFRALPEAITIRVGRDAGTLAKYQVSGPAAVHEFLHRLEWHEPPLAVSGAGR